MKLRQILFTLIIFPSFISYGQNKIGSGVVSGDIAVNGMYYIPDSLIGAEKVDSKVRANSWINLNYVNGNLTIGARYEYYSFPLIDFEKIGYKGQGITNYFADYKTNLLQITIGTFYEQFGQGFSLRAYEDRQLGIDNSLLGARLKIKPFKGMTIKGVWGVERNNFDFDYTNRNDFIRGIDGEISIDEWIKAFSEKGITLSIGGSFVSKYEKSIEDIYFPNDPSKTIPASKIPENVGICAYRMNFGYKGFRFETEYASKINDPNNSNNYIYKNGQALFMTLSYSTKGFGASASFLRADNMDFRSQRAVSSNSLMSINYIPAITRQYSYQLLGNYSYSSQPNNQIGVQGQINYKIAKNSLIGGKYGIDLTFNYSRFHTIDKVIVQEAIDNDTPYGTEGYSSAFFKFGKDLLYQDFGFDITKKLNKKFKLALSYNYIDYNLLILQGHGEMVHLNHVTSELTYRLNDKHALRGELHGLFTKEDMGSWVYGLLEYSISPKWFFSIGDQYNYGNSNDDLKIHYYNFSIAYVIGTTRIAANFGKTKEGILCIGGVCRAVPASYGMGINIATKF
jgi:hypothetical protein